MGDFYTKLVSLSLVSAELNDNIEKAVVLLELYSRDSQDKGQLTDAIELVTQVEGALKMVQLDGVEQLCSELRTLLQQQVEADPAGPEFFSACSTAMFILPRFLEHVAQRKQMIPQLLLPQINQLRECRGLDPLADSHFFTPALDRLSIKKSEQPESTVEGKLPQVNRLRHMYQLGFIQVLGHGGGESALAMMARAVSRLQGLCNERQGAKVWWAAGQAIGALQQGIALPSSRKILLRRLDGEIKRLSTLGFEDYTREYDRDLLKELLFLASSAEVSEELKTQLNQCLGSDPWYTEVELKQFRDELHGPSLSTLKSVVKALEEELRHSESILEAAALAGDDLILDFGELVATLGRISDFLEMVGLTRASTLLKEQQAKIEAWQAGEQSYSTDGLVSIADVLVYVENTVAGLHNYSLYQDDVQQLDHLSSSDAAAGHQLADAEAIVLKESQTGISMIKRAMSAFVDSNHDVNHIGNITQTLASIRGGLEIIQLRRASALVVSLEDFVGQILVSSHLPPTVNTLLETLADAVISLEHYLATYGALHQKDDNILILGEESMAALGFPVASSNGEVQ